jgi:uncharacterized protein (TIGR02118 family)
VAQALARPEIRTRFADAGSEPAASTPDQFARVIRADLAKWKQVIVAASVRIDQDRLGCSAHDMTPEPATALRGNTDMVKSISLLTRKPGITREEFIRHWVDQHAPLAHAVPGLRRYVLSLIEEEPTRPDIPTQEMQVDGIAELWYDDMQALRRGVASAEAQRLRADGALFIGRIKTFVTVENVIIPRAQ